MATSIDATLASVLGAATVAIESATGLLPSLVHLAPGQEPAWDDCCADGGQLYLRVVEIYPSQPFPQLDTRQKCGIQIVAIRLALGIIRCAHTVDDQGTPPTGEQMTDDALGSLEDSVVLLGVLSGLGDVPGVSAYTIGRWTPQGVQGGCAGGEWDFTIGTLGLCWIP